jgi:argininosuccinate lyase
VKNGKVLENLTMEEYKSFDSNFGEDLYAAIDLENCVEKRISKGGTGKASVLKQIDYIDAFLQGV